MTEITKAEITEAEITNRVGRRIRPLDILHLRGNRLFADSGHGVSVMPPAPSVFSGAIRSRILVEEGVSFEDVASGRIAEGPVRAVLGGGPDDPGSFRIRWSGLDVEGLDVEGLDVEGLDVEGLDVEGHAPKSGQGKSPSPAPGVYLPAPGDLVFEEGPAAEGADRGPLRVHRLVPRSLASIPGVRIGSAAPGVPFLQCPRRFKPATGVWIHVEAYRRHLAGEGVEAGDCARSGDLWKRDDRLGITLDPAHRSAAKGLLYTSEAIALAPGVSFRVEIAGGGSLVPESGFLRLGGDARAAAIETVPSNEDPLEVPVPGGDRFRMILVTPGLFPDGWLPPGTRLEANRILWSIGGLTAELEAASVSRHEVVSGWDLVAGGPKPAQRSVPAGSVTWWRWTGTTGGTGAVDVAARRAALAPLVEHGLWPLLKDVLSDEDPAVRRLWSARRAEGFNNVRFGTGESPDRALDTVASAAGNEAAPAARED